MTTIEATPDSICTRLFRRWATILVIAGVTFAVTTTDITPALAQHVVVPTFPVVPPPGPDWFLFDPDVAAQRDGSMLVLWPQFPLNDESQPLYSLRSQRASASGVPIGSPFEVAMLTLDGHSVRVARGADGRYLGAWVGDHHGSHAYAQLLDGDGEPLAAAVQLDDGAGDNDLVIAASALRSGFVAAWAETRFGSDGLFAIVLDAKGRPRDLPFLVTFDVALDPRIDVAPLRDGGFAIAWGSIPQGEATRARAYDAVGTPRANEFVVADADTFNFYALAASPVGDVLAVVGTGDEPGPLSHGNQILMRYVATNGTPLTALTQVYQSSGEILRPTCEFDGGGNLYVAWAGEPTLKGRGFDPAAVPIGPAGTVGGGPVYNDFHIIRLADGSFANVWQGFPTIFGSIVSLCTPGTSTCGDGVLAPGCEFCDAGAGNNDILPDACRTTCRPAGCGDGVIDTGEGCDDHNTVDCDGCSAECQPEVGFDCGDGMTSPACGEACDDGNATAGDGCTATCEPEYIPGGGSAKSDCHTAWVVNNPGNVPFLDSHGAVSALQQCTDGDAQCDFDGALDGSCTFHIRACAHTASNSAVCHPGGRLLAWTLRSPTASQAAGRPDLAAMRAALLGVVPSAIVGPEVLDVCSDFVPVTLPLRGSPGAFKPSKVVLKTTATLYSGARDSDKLTMRCLPAAGS